MHHSSISTWMLSSIIQASHTKQAGESWSNSLPLHSLLFEVSGSPLKLYQTFTSTGDKHLSEYMQRASDEPPYRVGEARSIKPCEGPQRQTGDLPSSTLS